MLCEHNRLIQRMTRPELEPIAAQAYADSQERVGGERRIWALGGGVSEAMPTLNGRDSN